MSAFSIGRCRITTTCFCGTEVTFLLETDPVHGREIHDTEHATPEGLPCDLPESMYDDAIEAFQDPRYPDPWDLPIS